MSSFVGPVEAYPRSVEEWEQTVRPEIMRRFRDEIYGREPEAEVGITWRTLEEGKVGNGLLRRQIAVTLEGPHGRWTGTVLVQVPLVDERVPAYLGLNFQGNHACTLDERILVPGYDRPVETGSVHYDHLQESMAMPPARGVKANRWPFSRVIGAGFAVVTLCYLQIGPDSTDVFPRGVHSMFDVTGADDRLETDWGAIGMWAWMLSRIQDGLERGMVPEIDATRVTLMGHSRLGKTALWAGARDERFAGVISNNSGCMGAAASRPVGETPEVLARVRPYWFARNFRNRVLAGKPLRVDQHQLLSCIAPRPLYVASASEDHNADPEGEFRSWQTAAEVWSLYGMGGVECEFPAAGDGVCADDAPLAYHLRSGPHSVESFDWDHWLRFCDRWVA